MLESFPARSSIGVQYNSHPVCIGTVQYCQFKVIYEVQKFVNFTMLSFYLKITAYAVSSFDITLNIYHRDSNRLS
jgi:hypothetical protein